MDYRVFDLTKQGLVEYLSKRVADPAVLTDLLIGLFNDHLLNVFDDMYENPSRYGMATGTMSALQGARVLRDQAKIKG